MPHATDTPPDTPWMDRPAHRAWLADQADRLWRFFEGAADPAGGFHTLDAEGRPRPGDGFRDIHDTTRMVHCFALAEIAGRPGAAPVVEHGLRFLQDAHRDPDRGGWLWSARADGAQRGRKTAYGHAFVLLAGASAARAGHAAGRALLDEAAAVIDRHFWDEAAGALREEFEPDWTEIRGYRGQNSNMHMVEALMAAHRATGAALFLTRAERIADLIVNRLARATGWRLGEHFDEDWRLDRDYRGDPMFRPAGITPGHGLEWARLLVELDRATGGRPWMIEAARGLFARALALGWDGDRGGIVYTVGWDDRVEIADRYWWPVCEGIGAARALTPHLPEAEGWYRRLWDVAATRFIDHRHGGWHPQIDAAGRPSSDPFFGKPDIYHALGACLVG